MNNCDCYHKIVDTHYFMDIYPVQKIYGICFGTKEQERCSCEGDRRKCDFYPHVREKAENELLSKTIIRCKDCKVPHNKYTGCPKLNGLVTFPDFYCGFAEGE